MGSCRLPWPPLPNAQGVFYLAAIASGLTYFPSGNYREHEGEERGGRGCPLIEQVSIFPEHLGINPKAFYYFNEDYACLDHT